MIDDPSCPICDARAWEAIGAKTFRRDADLFTWSQKIRNRVLFELWKPGCEEVSVQFVLCGRCGFVVFTPRPTAEDIDAKYRLFDKKAQRRRLLRPEVMVVDGASEVDARRSRELLAALAPHRQRFEGAEVLDFGGRNGALMVALVEADARCGVVDYTSSAIDGVELLGETLDSLPAERRFDLIVASHVLEHVPDPVTVVRRLAAHLRDGGLLFVEMPLEIAGGPPRIHDAVTHINFFSEPSLEALFDRAGLEVARCWTEACTFESGKTASGVRAVGRVALKPIASNEAGDSERAARVRTLLAGVRGRDPEPPSEP